MHHCPPHGRNASWADSAIAKIYHYIPSLILITRNTLPMSVETFTALWWCCSSAICSPCCICWLWMSRISVCCWFWAALRFCICVAWFCICVPWFCICVPWFCICVPWLCICVPWFCICVPWFCICVWCLSCVSQRFCITDSWTSCLLSSSPYVKKHK